MDQLRRKFGASLFFASVLILFAGITSVQAQENILGDWVFTMEMPDMGGMGMGGPGGGGMNITINSTFTKGDDGAITGTWEMNFDMPEGGMGGGMGGPGGGGFQMPAFKIVDVKIDGQKLTFTRTTEGDAAAGGMGGGGMMEDRQFTGTINGDTIELTSSSQMGDMTYKGTRQAAANTAAAASGDPLSGDWEFTMTMADSGMGMGEMVFNIKSTISKDAEGKYSMTWEQQESPDAGDMGGFAMPEVRNEDIKLDGDKLTFKHIASFGDMGGMGGGGDMVFNFAGTLKDNTVEGKLTGADNGMGMGATELDLKGKKVSTAPVAATSAKGLEGDWEFKMTMADSGMGMGAMTFDVKSTITKDADGNYAMTWNQTMNQSEGGDMGGMGMGGGAMTFNVTVSDIKLDGNKLTFNRTVDMGDMGGMGGGGEMVSTFTGTFEGDKIDGKISGDYGELTLAGSRVASKEAPAGIEAPKPVGLEGAWEFTTTFGDMGMEIKANATFTKAADGTFSCKWESLPMEGGMGGPGGEMPEITVTISDIKVDSNKVTFVQNVDMGGMGAMTSNFAGILDGDKIEGAFTMDMGEMPSVAIRKKSEAATGSDALTGDWELTMTMADNGMGMGEFSFAIKSTISKDAEGKYAMTWEQTMNGGDMGGMGGGMPQPEITISDIKLDGETLTFVQKVAFGDMGGGMGMGPMEMTSKFTGTVKDNTLEGKMVGEDNGMGMGAMEFTVKGSKK